MQTLHFSISIDAPVKIVWKTMLGDATYRTWTKAFDPTSTFEGTWEKGSVMRFIGGDGDVGMVSRVTENKPYEQLSLEHYGIIEKGNVVTDSEQAKEWAGAIEEYTFKEIDGKTEVAVRVDTADSMKEMMEEMWPKALTKLKEISES